MVFEKTYPRPPRRRVDARCPTNNADRVAVVFKIALSDETAVAVSEKNHGERVFFGKVFCDKKFVLDGVAVNIARMISDVVFLFGVAVGAMVVRKTIYPFAFRNFAKSS